MKPLSPAPCTVGASRITLPRTPRFAASTTRRSAWIRTASGALAGDASVSRATSPCFATTSVPLVPTNALFVPSIASSIASAPAASSQRFFFAALAASFLKTRSGPGGVNIWSASIASVPAGSQA
jgi:hypothetical protein